jgi:ubiquinone/menaquinone biosynthesis C-methylase UbiE
MKNFNVWNFYASFYERLFTQKISLIPTRKIICQMLETFIKDKTKTYRIFDCGCGTGQLIFEIKDNFKEYHFSAKGIDSSEKMIANARLRDASKDVEFIREEAENINGESSYDIIFCTHVLPYFKNFTKIICRLRNLLEENGVLYIAQTAVNNNYDRIVLFLLGLVSGESKYPSLTVVEKIIQENSLIISKKVFIKKNFLMPTIFVMEIKKSKI